MIRGIQDLQFSLQAPFPNVPMLPSFREQHIEKRSVRSARGLYSAFIDFAVLVHSAHEIAVALDDLFRLVVRYLERLDDEIGPVRISEHDVKHRVTAHIRIFVGRGKVLPRTMPLMK